MTFYKCDTTLSYVWHDSLAPGTLCANSCSAHGTWKVVVLIRVCDSFRAWHDSFRAWHDSFHAWHDSLTCVKCLFRASDTTRSCVCLDSSVCATRLLCMHDTTLSPVRHHSFVCWTRLFFMRYFSVRATRLFLMCQTTPSHVWHDSFARVARLFHLSDTTLLYVWHDSCVCATWFFHMCETTLSHAWHDSFMRDMTLLYLWHDSFTWETRLLCTCDTILSSMQHDSAVRVARICWHIGCAQHSFKLPQDPKTPVIMVGAGTGLAPLRGMCHHIEERKKTLGEGQTHGTHVLIFGCRRRDHDFLYGDEISQWAKNGTLAKVHLAFSRNPDNMGSKVYVQVWYTCMLNRFLFFTLVCMIVCLHLAFLRRPDHIDWFWLLFWLIREGAICTRIAPLWISCLTGTAQSLNWRSQARKQKAYGRHEHLN